MTSMIAAHDRYAFITTPQCLYAESVRREIITSVLLLLKINMFFVTPFNKPVQFEVIAVSQQSEVELWKHF